MNWALRNIGKRNAALDAAAIEAARRIVRTGGKAACWVAPEARRESTDSAVQAQFRRRR